MTSSPRRIPLAAKLLYTAFVAVLVPFYLKAYGPTNFLYFCDVALLLTLVSVWTEHPLPASAAAVGILLPQALWMVDFLATAAGHPLTGMTAYMFNPAIPAFARFLSFFHFWLPILLVWVLRRLGYDRRGLPAWTVLAWGLMLVSYTLLPKPPAPPSNPGLPVNVDYVFGLSDQAPQTWVAPLAWLSGLMTLLPLLVFWPTHALLSRAIGRRVPQPALAAE